MTYLAVAVTFALAVGLLVVVKQRRRGNQALPSQPPMPPFPKRNATGTRDGFGAGDHDRPFRFGQRPCAQRPYPFTTHQYARLLLLRSRCQDGVTLIDLWRGA